MKKKGIRQSRQDYIKRDIRELQKLGFSLTDIVGERSRVIKEAKLCLKKMN